MTYLDTCICLKNVSPSYHQSVLLWQRHNEWSFAIS